MAKHQNPQDVDKQTEDRLISDVSEIKHNVGIMTKLLVGSTEELGGEIIKTPGLVHKVDSHDKRLAFMEASFEDHITKVQEDNDKRKWKQAGFVAGAGAVGVGGGFGIKTIMAWISNLL